LFFLGALVPRDPTSPLTILNWPKIRIQNVWQIQDYSSLFFTKSPPKINVFRFESQLIGNLIKYLRLYKLNDNSLEIILRELTNEMVHI